MPHQARKRPTAPSPSPIPDGLARKPLHASVTTPYVPVVTSPLSRVRLARAIRDANAEPQHQQPAQQAQQQPQQQAPAQPQEQTTPAGLISSGEATNIAITSVAGGNNVSNVGCELSSESTEPRYVATFHYDDADYLVKVGARDGSVWYATAIFNDGTTSDVTNNTDDSSTEQATAEQHATDEQDTASDDQDTVNGQDTTADEDVEVNIEA